MAIGPAQAASGTDVNYLSKRSRLLGLLVLSKSESHMTLAFVWIEMTDLT